MITNNYLYINILYIYYIYIIIYYLYLLVAHVKTLIFITGNAIIIDIIKKACQLTHSCLIVFVQSIQLPKCPTFSGNGLTIQLTKTTSHSLEPSDS